MKSQSQRQEQHQQQQQQLQKGSIEGEVLFKVLRIELIISLDDKQKCMAIATLQLALSRVKTFAISLV